MISRVVGRLLILGALLLALPVAAFAQEATLTGTITDSTGGVLPGVTVVAVNQATGNRFEGVADERGIYRIAARVGTYQITADLQGFTTVTRPGLEVLAGQTATVNLQMAPSTVQETVTVTADAPLLNVTTSSLGGNVDPRQVQELPVSGRNWMQLAVLAPGSRTNAANPTTPLPDRNGGETREFQLNVDGQQVSTDIGTGSQARYSQDSIAEFQFLSNRFDATQGRSSGVQVNVITKSGTNNLSGLVRGNFRDDRFNAENPVLGRVVPFKNQQINLGTDLFDYYPPIQERVRWIIGARDLADARRKLRDYTTEGVAKKIEAPMVIGYGSDDRIMDPQGAYRLYQAAVNSKREMMAGLGHPHHAAKAGGPRDDRPATLQDWMMRTLRADAES